MAPSGQVRGFASEAGVNPSLRPRSAATFYNADSQFTQPDTFSSFNPQPQAGIWTVGDISTAPHQSRQSLEMSTNFSPPYGMSIDYSFRSQQSTSPVPRLYPNFRPSQNVPVNVPSTSYTRTSTAHIPRDQQFLEQGPYYCPMCSKSPVGGWKKPGWFDNHFTDHGHLDLLRKSSEFVCRLCECDVVKGEPSCEKRFNDVNVLLQHVREKHGQKPTRAWHDHWCASLASGRRFELPGLEHDP